MEITLPSRNRPDESLFLITKICCICCGTWVCTRFFETLRIHKRVSASPSEPGPFTVFGLQAFGDEDYVGRVVDCVQEDAKWFLEVRSFATATATAPPASLSTARPDPVLTPAELPFMLPKV